MTDPEFADATYIEPITTEFIERIIAREKPNALLVPANAIQDGVARAIDILAKEIRTTMQLIGATSVADLSPALVRLREAR